MNISVAKERLASVVKPDAVTSSEGDFLATHVELKRLVLLNKFEFVPLSKKYTSEEEIYNKFILNPMNKHQFIVVYGQSGTGKSHLIRWFEARYRADRPDDEVVLFIRRSDNTLKGTIRQLLKKPEIQEIPNKEIIKRLANASEAIPEDKLKDMIYHAFIVEINNDNNENEIHLNNYKRKRLVAFLSNETIHDHMMESGGPIDRIYSKVAENSMVDPDTIAQFIPEDFLVSADLFDDMQHAGADSKAEKMALALMSNDAKEDAKIISSYLNQFVSVVIQRCAGIEPGDFEQVFMTIRSELFRQGKNLTLFIEDITSFTGVDNALLNALMEDHNGRDICRISSVIGGTNGYINDFFRDNHKDRVTQYIYIPDNAFDEEGVFEFVGRYLNTMSLTEETIKQWVDAKALPADYPVHEVEEGKNWEFVNIAYGKKLCLYPFSKYSIRYLYQNQLIKGHRTPRYIIRDIIEPVVNDVLYNADNFPSIQYKLFDVNSTLNFIIHSQVNDEQQAERLYRFVRIWGNNEAKQYQINGVTYIAGLPESIYKEFKLPIVNLQQIDAPATVQQTNNVADSVEDGEVNEVSDHAIPQVPADKQKKLGEAIIKLTEWANGAPINLGTTGGAEGTIRQARDDIGEFLFDAIDWQIEGVSMDNVSKVKSATTGNGTGGRKLVALERQTKGTGFFTLPANFSSMNLIEVMIRWRNFGNQSWDYPGADFDVYLLTSWVSRIKKEVVESIKTYDGNKSTKYIEAAFATEIYRLILHGEYREKSLNNLTPEYLLCDHKAKDQNTHHSKEWDSLISLIHQKNADDVNKTTVRQYFNLVQGDGSKMIVLDPINFSTVLRKVKGNRLQIPEDEIQSDDNVKLRRDAYTGYEDIVIRIDNVAKAEIAVARDAIKPIYDCFDDDIAEEDIQALIEAVKKFYQEIETTQINVKTVSTEYVRKSLKQIVKALGDIGSVANNDDPLTILMAFSSDPVGTIQPLLDLINQVSNDISSVEKQVESRKRRLNPMTIDNEQAELYKAEKDVIKSDIHEFERLR